MSATPANPRPSSDYGLASLASPLNPQLDVVFVHGLNGSRCETWTNANNEIWLSWLGDMVPAARIWTYGYNSAAWRKPSKDALVMHCNAFLECCREKGIGNHDRVKVVLIGHSLGGILIKLVRTSKRMNPNIMSADKVRLESDSGIQSPGYIQLGPSTRLCDQHSVPGHAPSRIGMGKSALLHSARNELTQATLKLGCTSSEKE